MEKASFQLRLICRITYKKKEPQKGLSAFAHTVRPDKADDLRILLFELVV